MSLMSQYLTHVVPRRLKELRRYIYDGHNSQCGVENHQMVALTINGYSSKAENLGSCVLVQSYLSILVFLHQCDPPPGFPFHLHFSKSQPWFRLSHIRDYCFFLMKICSGCFWWCQPSHSPLSLLPLNSSALSTACLTYHTDLSHRCIQV